MSNLTLTKIRMLNGVWEGLVTGAADQPDIHVTHLDCPVPDVELKAADEEGAWHLRIPVPAQAIADGIQTFLVLDAATDSAIGNFSLIAGDALSDDLRAEVDLLRAELDMLKRAFRRHCLETM